MDRRHFKGTSSFLLYQQKIEQELTDLRNYIAESSDNLKRKQTDIQYEYKQADQETASEDGPDIRSILEDEIHKYHNIFPIYTFNPILLTLYGTFEFCLKTLCEMDHQKKLSNVQVSHLAGSNYIEKSRLYLELIAGIDISASDDAYKKIQEIQKIRNCIAHNNANIIKFPEKGISHQPLYLIIKNNTYISLDEETGDFHISNKEFLMDVIDLFEPYLKNITQCLAKNKTIIRNTAMPYDNTLWGQEKLKTLLGGIISILDMVDKFEVRTDEYRESDFVTNLRGSLLSLSVNLTKIYSMFMNGEWEVGDANIIVNDRQQGLESLTKAYKD